MIIRHDYRTAALAIFAAITLSLASSPEAAGRPRDQDHRPNLGGRAVSGGSGITWGHRFNPTGTRARDQDHRPGANVPPIVGQGGTPRPRAVRPTCYNCGN